jgi:hypothetical protein
MTKAYYNIMVCDTYLFTLIGQFFFKKGMAPMSTIKQCGCSTHIQQYLLLTLYLNFLFAHVLYQKERGI